MRARLLPAFLLLAAGVAQTPPPITPPRLLLLGPMPTTAAQVTLLADGTLLGTDGTALDINDFPTRVPAGTKDLLLRADRAATAEFLTPLLDAARSHGVGMVHFTATLPDGTAGAFVLALPEIERPATALAARLHHERDGVPPSSLTPLLQRLQKGWTQATKTPFVFGVELPDDATCEQLLQCLAAVAAAEVPSVVVTREPPDSAAHDSAGAGLGALAGLTATTPTTGNTLLAIDLGPALQIQVEAAAVPQPRPQLQKTPVGCHERANRAAFAPSGPAGGRFGGRGGAKQATHAAPIRAGLDWLAQQQEENGSFVDHDANADLQATSLVLLALLADGSTLDAGDHRQAVQRAAGWLASRQQTDGALTARKRRVVDHALATCALAEAAGLSTSGALLRGIVQPAIDRLFQLRLPDGGWSNGDVDIESPSKKPAKGSVEIPIASNVESTAHSLAAIAAARFFSFSVQTPPAQLVTWFDQAQLVDDRGRAAALFSRYFNGQNPGAGPAAPLLKSADPQDPWTAYWTTYALFQVGGNAWKQWSERLHPAVLGAQTESGPDAGSWPAAAGCSQVTTTALRVLTLEAQYRYTRLVR